MTKPFLRPWPPVTAKKKKKKKKRGKIKINNIYETLLPENNFIKNGIVFASL